MNKTIKLKTALLFGFIGFVLLINIQNKYQENILRKIRMYRAEMSATDKDTHAVLNLAIMDMDGVSSKHPFPKGVGYRSSGNTIICEWVGIGPRDFEVSSEGYSTQIVTVVSSPTNVMVSLTKLLNE
jgi:hypothetical protein